MRAPIRRARILGAMLTLRAAAALLAADGLDGLAALAAMCGCGGPLLPLDESMRGRLGLDERPGPPGAAAYVARGAGPLRALVLRADPGPTGVSLRELVVRVAARLARQTPHLAWLCIAAARRPAPRPARELLLASWWPDRLPPRLAALAVDQDAVVDSDAETLCGLATAGALGDTLTQARWLEVLGREALTRRFYRALRGAVRDLAATLRVPPGARRPTGDARQGLALLYASRLLFLAFLEAKGWLDGDRAFLARTFGECAAGGGGYHARVLRPLFFGTLNTPVRRRAAAARRFGRLPFLNGGLFAPTPLERRLRDAAFGDDALGGLLGGVLGRFRFTAREDRSTWSEAAVDPEMLGKAFEALMSPAERHRTGAYFTPQHLVERTTEGALRALLSAGVGVGATEALLAGEPVGRTAAREAREYLARVRVIDPACGSGAFLVHVLDVVSGLLGRVGDARPAYERRRAVLTRSIFGVDVNPAAVWLCELRLWLAVVVDCDDTAPEQVVPLPNLDRNIRVGDALTGGGFEDGAGGDSLAARVVAAGGGRIRELRERYVRAAGARKRAAARLLERAERARAIGAAARELAIVEHARRGALADARRRDLFGARTPTTGEARARRLALRAQARALRARLAALRDGAALPFAFAAHFADAQSDGGFDAVVGNPPWVRPHALRVADREWLHRAFAVCRDAAWARGAAAGRAGGFGAQVDLSALFLERGLSLVRPGGVVALLLPAKLWRCLAGGGARRLVMRESAVLEIEDWSASRSAFDAAAYPSLLVARRTRPHAARIAIPS